MIRFKGILTKHGNTILLVIIFIICEFLVYPLGEFPLNDDWSYSKSALILLRDGWIHIGEWPAMALFTHLIWGAFFGKIFGFSFFILRLSTIISSLIGVVVLQKLITAVSGNKLVGMIGGLALLFNPIYFSLGNTYMTDVNFNTLAILCVFYAYRFFQKDRYSDLMIVFLFSILLVLLRQFGIIFPVCFTVSCLVARKNKYVIVTALFGCLLVFASLHYYENYLRSILTPAAGYKFSGSVHFMQADFWNSLFNNITGRYRTILLFILFYTFPFMALFLPGALSKLNRLTLLIVIVFSAIIYYFLFRNELLLKGNIFGNMYLGAETFYESLVGKSGHSHTYSAKFEAIADIFKTVFVTGSIITILSICVYKIRRFHFNTLKINPAMMFFALVIVTYLLMLLITESYFDRYHLPAISVALILLSFFIKAIPVNRYMTFLPLACFCYVSLCGTRDYLEINRKRWEAYHFLRNTGVAKDKINGGFEVNCWNEGEQTWYSVFLDLNSFDYLIQFEREEGFVPFKTYEFKRCFPFKKDKIYIFVRQEKKPGKL